MRRVTDCTAQYALLCLYLALAITGVWVYTSRSRIVDQCHRHVVREGEVFSPPTSFGNKFPTSTKEYKNEH